MWMDYALFPSSSGPSPSSSVPFPIPLFLSLLAFPKFPFPLSFLFFCPFPFFPFLSSFYSILFLSSFSGPLSCSVPFRYSCPLLSCFFLLSTPLPSSSVPFSLLFLYSLLFPFFLFLSIFRLRPILIIPFLLLGKGEEEKMEKCRRKKGEIVERMEDHRGKKRGKREE